MPVELIVEGLDEIRARFQKAPGVFDAALRDRVEMSLGVLHESVPPYPSKSPESRYTRTVMLGKSLGSGFQGGKAGAPDIYTVTKDGSGYRGEFGTRLEYAPYVIDPDRQAWMHKGRWWTMKTLAERARAKIERLFQTMEQELARWLDNNA
jgi:hypothetical protein